MRETEIQEEFICLSRPMRIEYNRTNWYVPSNKNILGSHVPYTGKNKSVSRDIEICAPVAEQQPRNNNYAMVVDIQRQAEKLCFLSSTTDMALDPRVEQSMCFEWRG
jgi:hypothetical protein